MEWKSIGPCTDGMQHRDQWASRRTRRKQIWLLVARFGVEIAKYNTRMIGPSQHTADFDLSFAQREAFATTFKFQGQPHG